MAMLDDPELRWAAEISLGWIGSDAGDAAPRLISLLTNADWASRYWRGGSPRYRIGTATCNARQPALLAQLHDTNRFALQESIELALARQKAYPEHCAYSRLIQELQSEVVAGRFVPSRIRVSSVLLGLRPKSSGAHSPSNLIKSC